MAKKICRVIKKFRLSKVKNSTELKKCRLILISKNNHFNLKKSINLSKNNPNPTFDYHTPLFTLPIKDLTFYIIFQKVLKQSPLYGYHRNS